MTDPTHDPTDPTPDATPRPGRYAAGTFLKQSEAAEACGVSVDAIRRDRAAGAYPHAVRRDHRNIGEGTVWWVPVTDLVAAGRLDAGQVSAAVELLTATREVRQAGDLRAAVAELRATIAGLEQQILDVRALAALHEQHAAQAIADKNAAATAHQRDTELMHGLLADLRADLAARRTITGPTRVVA